jgi:hypothetical protein
MKSYKFKCKDFDCEFVRTEGSTKLIFNKISKSLVDSGNEFRAEEFLVKSVDCLELSLTATYLPGARDFNELPLEDIKKESTLNFEARIKCFKQFAKLYGCDDYNKNKHPRWL